VAAERPRSRWTLVALIGTASFINYLDRGSLAVAMLFHVVIDLMTLVVRPVLRGAWQAPAPSLATD